MLNFHTEYKTSKRRFNTINSLHYEIDKWNITESRKSLKKADPVDFVTFHKKNSLDTYFLFLTALVPLYYITALVFLYEKNDRGKNLFLPTAAMC
jgi:hypothetical protein